MKDETGFASLHLVIAQLLGSDNVAPTEEGLLRCPPILEMKYQNPSVCLDTPSPPALDAMDGVDASSETQEQVTTKF